MDVPINITSSIMDQVKGSIKEAIEEAEQELADVQAKESYISSHRKTNSVNQEQLNDDIMKVKETLLAKQQQLSQQMKINNDAQDKNEELLTQILDVENETKNYQQSVEQFKDEYEQNQIQYTQLLDLEHSLRGRIKEVELQINHLSQVLNVADLQLDDMVAQFYNIYKLPSLENLINIDQFTKYSNNFIVYAYFIILANEVMLLQIYHHSTQIFIVQCFVKQDDTSKKYQMFADKFNEYISQYGQISVLMRLLDIILLYYVKNNNNNSISINIEEYFSYLSTLNVIGLAKYIEKVIGINITLQDDQFLQQCIQIVHKLIYNSDLDVNSAAMLFYCSRRLKNIILYKDSVGDSPLFTCFDIYEAGMSLKDDFEVHLDEIFNEQHPEMRCDGFAVSCVLNQLLGLNIDEYKSELNDVSGLDLLHIIIKDQIMKRQQLIIKQQQENKQVERQVLQLQGEIKQKKDTLADLQKTVNEQGSNTDEALQEKHLKLYELNNTLQQLQQQSSVPKGQTINIWENMQLIELQCKDLYSYRQPILSLINKIKNIPLNQLDLDVNEKVYKLGLPKTSDDIFEFFIKLQFNK